MFSFNNPYKDCKCAKGLALNQILKEIKTEYSVFKNNVQIVFYDIEDKCSVISDTVVGGCLFTVIE